MHCDLRYYFYIFLSNFIVVPPIIVETMTSNDMVVREGTNITLTCKARGYPEPYVIYSFYLLVNLGKNSKNFKRFMKQVMWRREDGDEMSISGQNGEPLNNNFWSQSLHAMDNQHRFIRTAIGEISYLAFNKYSRYTVHAIRHTSLNIIRPFSSTFVW